MKTKVRKNTKRTISFVLTFMMLFSIMFIEDITYVNAWNNTTWYLGNDVKNVWDNSASACTMTKSGTQYYYDFYLKSTDADVYYRPYEKDNYAMGPTAGNNTKVTTTGTAGSGYNDNRCWYFDTADLTTANTFYQVRIYIDTAGNNGNGWSWYSATSKTNLTPTITRDKTSLTLGSSVSLTGGYTGTNIGTVKYNYQYSTNNSTWTTLNSTSQTGAYSWTPSSTGTYYVRVKATDTGVVKGTNARSAREYYSSSQTITVNPAETTYTVTKKYQVGGGTVTSDGTQSGIGSSTPTQMEFPTYRVANNIGYKLTGFSTSNVTIVTQDLTTGIITATASSSTNYITALYANEAEYKQFYFKKPSGWGNTLYAYLWDSSTVNTSTVKNKEWRGATLVDGAYQAAADTRTDSNGQQLDFVGSLQIQNGSSAETYYYYKTYYMDYDGIIFSDDSHQTGDLDASTDNSGKYYDQSSTSWKDLPASMYTVSVSAADTAPTYINTSLTGTVTGTITGDTNGEVYVNGTTGKTITVTPPAGYKIDTTTPFSKTGSVTITNGTVSTSSATTTIKATANGGTVTPNFVETSHTITVKRRLFTTGSTSATSTTTLSPTYTAGISSYATISQPGATSGYYSWEKYTLANGVQANPTSTTLTTRAALKVNAKTSGTYVVYEDYRETLNTITFKNDGHGSVKRGSTTIVNAGASNSGTTKIGNITAVTITAQASEGYEFDKWEITSGSGVTIGSTTTAQTTFKASATATITAKFKPVAYSIGASFPSGNEYNSSCVVNTYASDGTTLKTGGQIGDTFQIRVTLASGYDVDSITFATGTGYATPTSGSTSTSGSTKIYNYTLGNGSAVATVTLKAAAVGAPTVQIQGQTEDNTFSYVTLNGTAGNASGNIAKLFYLQPINIMATIDSYTTETAVFSVKNSNASTTYSTTTENTNSTMNPLTISNSLDGSATSTSYTTYRIDMTVTNAPAGVTAATLNRTYYIRIYYNSAQKAYLKIKNLCDCTVEETATTAETYYDVGAPWEVFNSTRSQAISDYKGTNWNQWPAYNSTSAQGTTLNTYYNNLKTKFNDLQQKAKTTTVYVLSKYQNNNSNQFMSIRNTRIGSSAENIAHFNHCRQYHYYLDSSTYHKAENVSSSSTYVDHLMRLEGSVQKSGTTYYLYSFTYAGHSTVAVYDAATKAAAYSAARGLTGTVGGLTEFKDYYINVYNTNINTATVTSANDFVDLQSYRTDVTKAIVENGVTYNATNIRNILGLATKGSLKDSSPTADVEEVSFEIQTVKGGDSYTNLLSGESWKPESHGRYKVKYQVRYKNSTDSYTGGGATFTTEEKEYYIYVAWDEISVYVDMNGNVGTPTLNFTYDTNKNLPFDMNLVSGSESIYEYTLDLKKLKDDYQIAYKDNNSNYQPITINKITVDGTQIGSTYTVQTDAYMTGSVWFKANSTNLTQFMNISSASSKTTFRAVVDSTGAYIEDGIKSVSGTGIITENDGARVIDGVHHVVYAAKDELEFDFSYNVRATANKEVKIGNTVYYFDRWMKMQSPDEVLVTVNQSDNTFTVDNLSMSSLTNTGVEKTDYNINKCPVYNDGDFTYVAVYKPAATTSVVRVELNYNFKDYNTDDGNYIYDEHKDLADVSYTKTVKIPIGSGQTYSNYAAVKGAIDTIASQKKPVIKSNYFDYSYENNSAAEVTTGSNASDSANRKIVVNARLTETAHKYKMYVVKDNTQTLVSGNHYYQQTVDLDASTYGISSGNVYWYIKDADDNEVVLSNERTYTARFVQSTADAGTDNIKIYLKAGTKTVDKTSTIINSYSETYKDGDTDKVRHNFYIVDYFDESVAANGDFVGAGVLYATTDLQGNYRQPAAETQLASTSSMKTYIANALGVTYNSSTDVASSSDTKYDVEYEPQTISNVGFRYLPASGKEGKDKLRYSEMLKAYQYIFGAQMNNSPSYENQKLRVYSFFIYKNSSNQYKIVVSGSYAEVVRYYPQNEAS